jgi:hypothetical protein
MDGWRVFIQPAILQAGKSAQQAYQADALSWAFIEVTFAIVRLPVS